MATKEALLCKQRPTTDPYPEPNNSRIHLQTKFIKDSIFNIIGLALDRYRWRALVNSVMNLRVP
jgi:hypothetical protein